MKNSFLRSILNPLLFFVIFTYYPVLADPTDKALVAKKTTSNPRKKSNNLTKVRPEKNTQAIAPIINIDYLQPKTYWIQEIQVIGAKSIEADLLIAMSGLQVGQVIQIPSTSIRDAIERLWKQKLLSNVSIYVTNVIDYGLTLAIHIEESALLSRYTIEGITKREKKNIKEEINLREGKIITPQLLKQVKAAIKKYFLDKGYRDVSIQITQTPDPADPAYEELQIHIHKGEKAIINKIIIIGNEHLDSDLLKSQWQLQEKPRFTLVKDVLYKICTLHPIRKNGILRQNQWPNLDEAMRYFKKHVIFTSSQFTKAKYKADKNQIITAYQNQGYRDATIVQEKVYSPHKGLLNIALRIKEGKQYYIRKISWVGNQIYTTQELNKVLNIKSGSIYSTSLLRERLYFSPDGEDISSLYMDNGYLFFNIEPREIALEGNQVDLELVIQEGTQATINHIAIVGNRYTNEAVIRRELKVLPGDKFSRKKIIRSQRELAMLNIFDPNKMDIIPVPNMDNDTVDIIWKVKEALRFDAKLGAQLGGGAAVTISADIGTNNFSLANALRGKIPLGDVQSMNLKAAFTGLNRQELSLKFTEPWLYGKKPTALDVSIAKVFHQQPDKESSKSNKSAKHKKENRSYIGSFSVHTGLGKRLTWPDDYCSIKGGFKYQFYNYKHHDILNNNKKYTNVMHDVCLDLVLERNTLNQPIYPTEGSVISLQSKFSFPHSLFDNNTNTKKTLISQLRKKEYIQPIVDFNYYYNVVGDWVINIFSNAGFLTNYAPHKGIGPFERFVLGGREMMDFSILGKELISLRGYSPESITPKEKNGNGYEGGVIFDKIGAELRHPIIKSSMFFVYALCFFEAGNTWAYYKDWKLWDLKKSAGIGLRLYLPIGLIGIDWGYGFDSEMLEKLEIHWSVGGSLR